GLRRQRKAAALNQARALADDTGKDRSRWCDGEHDDNPWRGVLADLAQDGVAARGARLLVRAAHYLASVLRLSLSSLRCRLWPARGPLPGFSLAWRVRDDGAVRRLSVGHWIDSRHANWVSSASVRFPSQPRCGIGRKAVGRCGAAPGAGSGYRVARSGGGREAAYHAGGPCGSAALARVVRDRRLQRFVFGGHQSGRARERGEIRPS